LRVETLTALGIARACVQASLITLIHRTVVVVAAAVAAVVDAVVVRAVVVGATAVAVVAIRTIVTIFAPRITRAV